MLSIENANSKKLVILSLIVIFWVLNQVINVEKKKPDYWKKKKKDKINIVTVIRMVFIYTLFRSSTNIEIWQMKRPTHQIYILWVGSRTQLLL